MLTDQDAKTYGAALANAMRHVPIGITQKALDFSALAFCIINMETPRVMASARIARERRTNPNAQPRGPAEVFQFRPPNNPPPPQPTPTAAAASGGGLGAGVVGAVARGDRPLEPGFEGFTGDGIDSPIGGH